MDLAAAVEHERLDQIRDAEICARNFKSDVVYKISFWRYLHHRAAPADRLQAAAAAVTAYAKLVTHFTLKIRALRATGEQR